jgi:putative tricarboxylic transport membrane protein
LIAGAALLVAGAVLLVQALIAGFERGIVLGGPALAPIIVTGLWVVLALAYLSGRLRSAFSQRRVGVGVPDTAAGTPDTAVGEPGAANAGRVAGPAAADTVAPEVAALVVAAPVVAAPVVAAPEIAAPDTAPVDAARPVRWHVPFLLLALLIGYAVALKYTMAGYVVATSLFFIAAARLLSTRPLREVILRDVLVALGLSLAIYLAFTRLLGIVLPAGVLPL